MENRCSPLKTERKLLEAVAVLRWAKDSSLGKWRRIKDLVERVLKAMAGQGKAHSVLFFAFLLSLLANLALIIVTALGLMPSIPYIFLNPVGIGRADRPFIE
jgi:hypothetical protein